jgi:hypothetical protein
VLSGKWFLTLPKDHKAFTFTVGWSRRTDPEDEEATFLRNYGKYLMTLRNISEHLHLQEYSPLPNIYNSFSLCVEYKYGIMTYT